MDDDDDISLNDESSVLSAVSSISSDLVENDPPPELTSAAVAIVNTPRASATVSVAPAKTPLTPGRQTGPLRFELITTRRLLGSKSHRDEFIRTLLASGWKIERSAFKKVYYSPAGVRYESLPKIAAIFPELVPK